MSFKNRHLKLIALDQLWVVGLGFVTLFIFKGLGVADIPWSGNISQGAAEAAVDVIPADRLIDWSYCGIPGGIPNRETIHTALQPGVTAAKINAAIAAASGSGKVVYLAAGTYNLSAEIDIVAATDVTIRGAGAGKTIINFKAAGGYSIASRPGSYFHGAISGGTNIASGYSKGSKQITLASLPPASFKTGNLVQLVQNDDYSLVFHRAGNWAGNRNLRHTTLITGVSGKVINLATPIPYSFSAVYHPQANAMPVNAKLVGVEDLTIMANNKLAIAFGGADRCWVKGVETSGTANSSIEFRASSQCEVRQCYIHDASGYPNQPDGYGVLLFYGTSYCRIEDNIGYHMANLMMMYGTSANAILYNVDRDGGRAGLSWISPSFISNHGPHGIMNLFEGNIIARFQSDGYHGSTSHAILLRNQIHGLGPWAEERRLVDLCRGSYFHSVIGNVIGDASWAPKHYQLTGSPGHSDNGCVYILGYPNMGNTHLNPYTTWENYKGSYPDVKVEDTLIRHGNYDYFNKAVVWDEGINSQNIPTSFVYSSKPDYFGLLQWPPIGHDVSGFVSATPAKARWDAFVISGDLADLFK